MSAVTYTLAFNWQTPGNSIGLTLTAGGSAQTTFDVAIAANQTNFEIDCAIPVAPELQAFLLVATQNMTIKTNNSGSPTDTINLVAGIPFFWIGNGSIPLSGAITKLFVTNTTAGTLSVRACYNSAPNNV